MTVPVVLDASALLAIALSERGGDAVLTEMRKAPGDVLIHAVNAYEVAFKLMIRGIPEAMAWDAATYGGVRLVRDMGATITVGASRLKVSNMFLSMADSFCLALGEAVGGVVLTSDKAFSNAKTDSRVILFRE